MSESSRKAQQRRPAAQLLQNMDGLVEVQVEYQHCASMARETGFRTAQILEALLEDNQERRDKQLQTESSPEGNSDQSNEMDQGERLSDFEPDSEEEGDSDME